MKGSPPTWVNAHEYILIRSATHPGVRPVFRHDGPVNSAVFSPDGALIVTASADKTARIWDAATGKVIEVFRGHDSQVYSAAFSPDGARVVTASGDKTARLWDVKTGGYRSA